MVSLMSLTVTMVMLGLSWSTRDPEWRCRPRLWREDFTEFPDNDGDGFTEDEDCDDDDASIYPTAFDISNDGIDQNCDGLDVTFVDNDGDGFIEDDCDDGDGSVCPGASEIPNDGIDQDCDGEDFIEFVYTMEMGLQKMSTAMITTPPSIQRR